MAQVNTQMESTLLFFTNQYPFGQAENFIESEIIYLAQSFEKIYILPLESDFETKRKIPDNAEIVDLASYHLIKNSIDKKWLLNIDLIGLFNLLNEDILNPDLPIFKDISNRLINTKWILIRARILEIWIKEMKLTNCVFYSYWFSSWASILSILKKNNTINSYICRAHGFDLYADRYKYNFISFQEFKLKNIETLFLISEHGFNYLSKKYPEFAYKLKINYLGTVDKGLNKLIYTNDINIISISNLIPLKRIHLIIEILQHIPCNVKWTHIGSGVLLKELVSRSNTLPSNIKVSFLGQIENEEVIDYLKEQPITFLINVSESEGIPVSMMEAISFGIPVVATNVGGVNEIVNSKTGLLIHQNFEIKKTALEIYKYIEKFNDINFRIGVRSYWSKNFDASINYPIFIDSIKSIIE